jgi:hypothetical protein
MRTPDPFHAGTGRLSVFIFVNLWFTTGSCS